jgi:hypothetical protein
VLHLHGDSLILELAMPLHNLIMINPPQIDIRATSIDSEVELIIPENKTLPVDLIGARMEFLHGRSSATPKENPEAEVLIQQRQRHSQS